jgi:very-short-patch-repair endonuclease
VALRDLLRTVAGGSLETADESSGVAPDPLMTELANRLRREGLVVAERVGTGPHRVDLAVTVSAHPERWLLAVDGDGPEYATWRGTRERDRLWPQELQRRGWRHLRVWSTDLYRDPARDVARIVSMVREEARAAGVPAPDPVEPEAAEEGVDGADSAAASEPAEPARGDPGGSTHNEPGSPAGPEAAAEASSRRRRRAVRRGTSEGFDAAGQTTDDTDVGWGERRDEGGHDQWLRNQRPPHWD